LNICKHHIYRYESNKFDIACIHDCHALHSSEIKWYKSSVEDAFKDLFSNNNQFYYLLKDMLDKYYDKTGDIILYNEFLDKIKHLKKDKSQVISLVECVLNASYMTVPK